MSRKISKVKQGLLLLCCLVAATDVSKLHLHKWKQDMKL